MFSSVMSNKTGSFSNMIMKYSMDAKFVAQDYSLNVEDHVIDAISYRKGLNGISADTNAASLVAADSCCCAPTDSCSMCCAKFGRLSRSCFALNFICSTQQCMIHPKFCGGCCAGCSCKGCTSCCEEEKQFFRFLSFSAYEEFQLGVPTKREPKIEPVLEEKDEYQYFPIYCLPFCCLVFPNPLPKGNTILLNNPVVYCCPPAREVADPTANLAWEVTKKRHDEITAVFHYVHPLDQTNHSCKLTMIPEEGTDIDAAYNKVRKFISLLAEKRCRDKEYVTKRTQVYVPAVTLKEFVRKQEA